MINIIFILLLHVFLLNPLEKSFFHNYKYFKNISWRPTCNNGSRCYGMPSGSTELIVIFCSYFLQSKIILASILIFIVCFMRIYLKRHSLLQVIIGLLFGVFYSLLYVHFNFSLLVTILFILIFLLNPKLQIKELHKLNNIYKFIKQ